MAKRKPVTEGTVAVTMQRAADVFGRRGLMLAELAAYCSLRSSDEAGVGNQVAADEWAVLAYQYGLRTTSFDEARARPTSEQMSCCAAGSCRWRRSRREMVPRDAQQAREDVAGCCH